MSFITESQADEIAKKDFYQGIHLCYKDKESILHHDDALKRYIGIRKKTVVYNNTNSNIIICIKPAPHFFISNCSLTKNMSFSFTRVGDYEPMKIILSPKSYQKILVPTTHFILTVCIKSGAQVEQNVTSSPESPSEHNYFNAFLNYASYIIGNTETRISNLVSLNRIKSNPKWRIMIKEYPLDTSYDIFLNESQFKNLKDLPEIEYNNIGL